MSPLLIDAQARIGRNTVVSIVSGGTDIEYTRFSGSQREVDGLSSGYDGVRLLDGPVAARRGLKLIASCQRLQRVVTGRVRHSSAQ